MSDFIQVVGTIGTLVIALASLVIAVRQTRIAHEQTRLGEIQNNLAESQAQSAEIQVKIDTRLMDLELNRSKPEVVLIEPRWTDQNTTAPIIEVTAVNVGGAAAVDVWLEWVSFYGELASSKQVGALKRTMQKRIDLLLPGETKIVRFELDQNTLRTMPNLEGVLKFSGHLRRPDGQEDEVSYSK